jgi:hypothetical protein
LVGWLRGFEPGFQPARALYDMDAPALRKYCAKSVGVDV